MKKEPVKKNATKINPAEPKKAAVAIKSKKRVAIESTQDKFGLFNLKTPKGAHKPRKIKGRGPGSGHGKTSTRGSKGQTSRAGRHFYLGFEGGQSPLIRRMPKRGFTSNFKKIFQIVNLRDIAKIKEAVITPELMQNKGLIKHKERLIKVLGSGEIKGAITVQAHAFSKKAVQEIKNLGGSVEIINA